MLIKGLTVLLPSCIFCHIPGRKFQEINALLIVMSDRTMTLINLLFLSFILSVGVIPTSHAKDTEPLKLGKCDPDGAVKTLDAGLKKGKSLNAAMEMVINNKQFDGSNACITFIREASMEQRESAPYAFKKLWME
ncbi:hypothetical protein [Synechococcus sp. WH 8016]|uniref:hypothetical protein n=1 Tax=Synechococcus sp. WH 8016 TaxID=166318 RepID=UPI00022D9CA0|nr:hypothetical protein [Synechococcus sp. WH 8016]EHA60500.1 hypothetical protein Syn8016DRAFT_2287 [Synechococcus sp. WH 8016]